MAFIMYGNFMKTVAAGNDVKLFSTGVIYFHIAQYLPWFATTLVSISAGILPVYIFEVALFFIIILIKQWS